MYSADSTSACLTDGTIPLLITTDYSSWLLRSREMQVKIDPASLDPVQTIFGASRKLLPTLARAVAFVALRNSSQWQDLKDQMEFELAIFNYELRLWIHRVRSIKEMREQWGSVSL